MSLMPISSTLLSSDKVGNSSDKTAGKVESCAKSSYELRGFKSCSVNRNKVKIMFF